MKIVHVVRSLIINSGVSVFAAELANAQAAQGHDVFVRYTWKPDYLLDSRLDAASFESLDELNFRPDIVHIHALWSLDMIRAMWWCRKHRVKYFVSPHGGLMPRVMNKGWLKKHVFYWLFLKGNLKNAAAIHCTGDAEVDAVKRLGIKTTTFIVPLGCHLPAVSEEKAKGAIERSEIAEGLREQRNVLFLGRLGEEKGLMYLLDAWKSIDHKGWKLTIAGPSWLGYGGKLKVKVDAEGIEGVLFPGNANEAMKDALYRTADLFILPSPTENFSMVVLDALAYGVPVICTKGTPWKCIEDNKCGWWIEPNSVEAIRAVLEKAMNLSQSDAEKMCVSARKLATQFSWSEVAKKIETACMTIL